jgi:hypothetical protein
VWNVADGTVQYAVEEASIKLKKPSDRGHLKAQIFRFSRRELHWRRD